MQKIITLTLLFSLLTLAKSYANNRPYPNISGEALIELRVDQVTTTNANDIPEINGSVFIDSIASLNLNNNWSIKTKWEIKPIHKRSSLPDGRSRLFLDSDRQINIDNQGVILEEIKGQFQNEDLAIEFGKLNPFFGVAHEKSNRIGIFTTDFTEDYELREKIGFTIMALLENSKISVSNFFNDNSGLSNSAITQRGRDKQKGAAGNTSTLSSYSVSMEGKDLFGVPDLYYNIGYRNLDTENINGYDNESGYVGGLQYLIPIGSSLSIIPFIEIAKFDNAGGISDRNILYSTAAIIARYSGWNFGISNVQREIRQKNTVGNLDDSQMQYFVGYKFKNGLMFDISKMDLKENNKKADMIGAMVSYLYEF